LERAVGERHRAITFLRRYESELSDERGVVILRIGELAERGRDRPSRLDGLVVGHSAGDEVLANLIAEPLRAFADAIPEVLREYRRRAPRALQALG
jgi:hypothetical protein